MNSTLLSSEIAEPYAQALMALAQSKSLTNEFGEDLRSLEGLLEASPELRFFISSPVVQEGDKKAILRRIMGDRTSPYLMNFLMLLVDKRRVVFLEPIVAQYLTLLRKLNNVVLAEVTSARGLSDGQIRSVIDRVRGMTQARDVEVKTQIDPDILGGVIIKVGSQIIDASLRGQLRRIGMTLNA
ncbi:ATP synthase F1 subunit delta [Spirulina subsalsa]|uniref:ATP synthase F1 subunit delta n=1 Tax=Spirulina subsalsa TaxID=54311 RepID=UPI0002DB2CC9|nr:ATP synthase F1 subunit delta [Spirulina subsalsa]